MAKDFLNKAGYPLGLRNNNPGNLRDSGDQWLGMTGIDNRDFIIFQNCSWGLRALAITLRTKINRGSNTLKKLIYEYAPPSENDSEAYLQSVMELTGIDPSKILSPTDNTLLLLMNAIVYVEIGSDYYYKLGDSDFKEGIAWMNNPPGTVSTSTAAIGFGGSILLFGFAVYLFATIGREYKPAKRRA